MPEFGAWAHRWWMPVLFIKSAKFKARWFELDIGWIYIHALKLIGLAKIEYARNYGSAAKRHDELAVEH